MNNNSGSIRANRRRFWSSGRGGHAAAIVRAADCRIEMLEARWLLSAATWVGAAGGNWNVASNWSTNAVPGGGDDVTLNAGASLQLTDAEDCSTITTDANSTITLVGGSLDVRTSGLLNGTVSGSGTFMGPTAQGSALTFAGTTTFDSNSGLNNGNFQNTGSMTFLGGIMHGSSLNNSGTISFASNTTSGMGFNTTLTNLSSGTLTLADGALLGDDTFGTGGTFPQVINYGSLIKTGTASGGFSPENGAALTVQDIGGTINSQGGNLDMPIPGQFQNTTFMASDGATITLDDTNGAVEYSFSGTVTGSGAGHLLMADSGANTGNPAIQNTNPTAAAILNFPGSFAQVSGMYFQANSFTVVNQGTLNYVGSTTNGNAGLDNVGTINVLGSGDFDVNRNGTFTNDTTGVLNFETDAGVTNDNGGTAFINKGLIEKTGGAGTSTIGDGTANIGFVNEGGTYDVEIGTINIANGGGDFGFTIPDNGIVAAPGATFALGGNSTNPRIFVQGNLSISGGGNLELTGGYLHGPNSGYQQDTSTPATLNFTGDQFLVDGGAFDDNTNLINEGDINFESGDLGSLMNKGTITVGSGAVRSGGGLINAAGAFLYFSGNDQILALGNNGNIQNAGTMNIVPGAGNAFDFSQVEISNTGTINFGAGTTNLPWISNGYVVAPGLFPSEYSIPAGSTFDLQSGATVTVDTSPHLTQIDGTVILGSGASFPAIANLTTITGELYVASGDSFSTAGNLTNNGTLSIGGTFTVNGNYTQAVQQYVSAPPTPTLDFEIAADPGSANAPNFTVTGNSILAGNLTADYVNGYTTAGGTWTVATFDSPATGSFASTGGTAPFFTPTVTASLITLAGTAFTGTGGSGGTGGGGGGGGNTGGETNDLAVTAVAAPADFIPGQSETLTWTVANDGSAISSGNWQDSVYLSTDGTLSLDDLLLGRVSENGPLAANATYTGTLTVDMPAVAAGNYQIIVVADSRNALSDTNRTNNTGVSAAAAATIPALTLGTTTTGNISASQEQVYALTLQAGTDAAVSVTLADALEANIYISKGQLPTTQAFDQAATSPDQTSANFLLHVTQTGTYYILVYGRPHISGSESFSIMPTLLAYGPASVTPTSAVAVGQTTLTISGRGFTNATTANLIQGATTLAAQSVTFVNSNTLYATFLFSSAPTGNYDVQTVTGSQSASLASAFTVNAYNPTVASSGYGQLYFSLSAPSFIRAGAAGTITLFYENVGGTDIGAPLFTIESDNASFQYPGDDAYSAGGINVLGINPTGPAGLLSPGASGSITLSFEQITSGAHVTSTFHAYLVDDSATTDWDQLKKSLEPTKENTNAWNQTYANFKSLIGTTVGSYRAELEYIASDLAEQGQRTGSNAILLNYALQIAGNFGQIDQQYNASAFGYGVADPYNQSAITDSKGNVGIGAGDQYEVFLKQSDGSYTNGNAGDYSTLTLSAGHYTVTQTNGSESVFNATTGALEYLQDSNGNVTTATVNADNLVTALTSANGDAIQLTYNSANEVSQLTDPQGRITTYSYDSDGNLHSVTDAAGTTSYSYNTPANHEVNEIAYANGTHLYLQYDSFGRISEQYGDGNSNDIKYTYDNVGNITQTDSLGDITQITRGNNGSILAVQNPLGDVFSSVYATQVTPTSTTDALGQSTTTTYDSAGNITSITAATGAKTSFTYNSFGEPLTETDPNNHTTTFTYDPAGNLTGTTDIANQASNNTYTSTGLLQSSSSAAGRVISNTYNSAGLLTSQTFSDGSSASYTYDAHNNVLTATNSTFGTETFTYDSADRLTSVSYPDGLSLAYAYNSNGQLASVVDQTGFTTNYSYNAQGLLAGTTDANGNAIATYTYDGLNRIARIDLGNGSSTVYSYNSASQVTSIYNYAADGSVASSFVYTYDKNGNIATETTAAGMATYSYDAGNQLTQAALPGGETITYTYDAAGNRISAVDSSSGATSYTTNNLNEYTSATGATYTYDADGNLISQTDSTGTTIYTYNALNELVSMNVNGTTTTFIYDAMGNRVGSTTSGVTTYNLIDPTGTGTLVGQFTSAGAVISHYTFGVGLTSEVDGGGHADYYAFDAAGNTADLTGAGGSVANTYSYLPFGQQLSATGSAPNLFTFSGKSGVVSLGDNNYLTSTRLYSASVGRFTQRDPLGLFGGDANLYRYVNNNPVNNSDPSGMLPGFETSVLNESYLRNLFEGTLDAARATVTDLTTAGSQAFQSSLAEGETFVSELASNTGTVFSEYGTALADEGVPVVFNEAETFATNTASYLTSTGPRQFINLGGRLVSVSTETVGAVTGVAVAAPAAVYAGFKFNQWFNNQFPDGIPVATQDVLNSNSVYRRILRDPLGAQLLKDVTADGSVPSQNTLNTILQTIAQSQRQTQTQAVTSHDPNQIIGPAGYGAANFIPAQSLLPYEIDFTNEAAASAPAQVVTVTQQLSSSLDWSTFQLGNIGFGRTTITVPAGLQTYSTVITLSSALAVDVAASFDPATGLATWTFTSIDPNTGDVPSDPLSGFLPPDVTAPEGEGYVGYTVRPSSTATTGAVISAQATVVFDNNPAINTAQISNTLDAGAPSSAVTALAATQSTTYFTVSWSGSDDANGSGIASYTIFVSEDGGDFTPWLANTAATSAQYLASPGHTYAFYSVALDNAGNEQPTPASGQTTTSVPAIARTINFGGKTKATYTDSAGHAVTITLSGPSSGVLSFLSNDKADPISLVLSDTTEKSSLTVKVRGGVTTLGSVQINGSLKSFNANDASFAVNFTVTGTLGSLALGGETLTQSAINIEGASVPTKIKLGNVSDLSLNDAAPIKSLMVLGWTAGPFAADTITAPSIGSLKVRGDFDPDVTLTAAGLDLKSAQIKGSITLGSLNATGSIGSVSAASIGAGWTSTIAGSVASIKIHDNFAGALTAASANTAHIGGNLSAATLTFTGSAGGYAIRSLIVGQSVSNTTLDADANVGIITVGGMSDSKILIGVAADTTALPANASAFTSAASLKSFTTRGKSAFSNTIIAASSISKITLANVTTGNGGILFGVATTSLGSFVLKQPKSKPFVYTKRKPTSDLNNLPGDLRVNLLST